MPLLAILVTSCSKISPSGELITQTRTFSGSVDKLQIASGFVVDCDNTLAAGTVEITTNSNIMQYVITEVKGDALCISIKGSFPYNKITLKARISPDLFNHFDLSGGSELYLSNAERKELELDASGGSKLYLNNITTKELEIDASGGSDIKIDGLETEKFTADASGGSKLYLNNITTKELEIDTSGGSKIKIDGLETEEFTTNASGGSEIEANGKCHDLEATLTGSSKVLGQKLTTENVEAMMSGGSKMYINVTNSIIYDGSGGSQLYYTGEPAKVHVQTSGDSELIKE